MIRIINSAMLSQESEHSLGGIMQTVTGEFNSVGLEVADLFSSHE